MTGPRRHPDASPPGPALNLDRATVDGFGDEWSRFDQSALGEEEHRALFEKYFRIFPWAQLPPAAAGFDLGCGSGRWAKLVAPRVGHLTCVDASERALEVARRLLAGQPNCRFVHASVDRLPIEPGTMDFGYSLGVLHHVPDTAAGLRACVRCLKPGGVFLVYLYYAFDNRPAWYRAVWQVSELGRHVVSRLPHPLRHALSQLAAAGIYWPLARGAALAERAGADVRHLPLAFYRHQSFYTMRTDALDRFGTRLEQRFSRAEITRMMEAAGLGGITFSDQAPFWCAVGVRRA
jgi:SAM-dependent methyltransferase